MVKHGKRPIHGVSEELMRKAVSLMMKDATSLVPQHQQRLAHQSTLLINEEASPIPIVVSVLLNVIITIKLIATKAKVNIQAKTKKGELLDEIIIRNRKKL